MTLKNQNIFSNFTNLYSLSKTLRFELKPIGKTEEFLKKNKVFEKDKKIADSYKEAKKYFNILHREFIDNALSDLKLPTDFYKDFGNKFLAWKENKNKTSFIEREKSARKLRTSILDGFNKKANEWRDEYSKSIKDEKKKKKILELEGMDVFFKVEVFDFLKQKYPEAQIDGMSIFNPFNKFSGYFRKFHETRKNFYKDDGTSTAIPTRIIDNNLTKFLENKNIFETRYFGKCKSICTETEREIFNFEHINNCFTQTQIDEYNETISSLKSKINELRQNNPDINKKDLPFFKRLFKQILGQRNKHETEQDDFIEVLSDKDVLPILQKFINENMTYIPKAEFLFEKFMTSQKNSIDDYNIAEIYVASRFINSISNRWFSSWNTISSLLCDELKLKKDQKKLPDFISIATFKAVLEKARSIIDAKDLFREDFKNIFESEMDFYQIFLKIWQVEFDKTVDSYKRETENAEKLIAEDKQYLPMKKGMLENGKEGNIQKEKLLDYANSALALYQMIKYFSLEKGKEREWNPDGLDEDRTGNFYDDFNEYYENVNTWKYFNEFRNYLTKKPYSDEKIKLNFDHKSLLNGFTESKTENSNNGTQYGAYIFRKQNDQGEYNYFLGISTDPSLVSYFDKPDHTGNSEYERLNYYQILIRAIYGTSYEGDYQEDKKNLTENQVIQKIKKALTGYTSRITEIRNIIDTNYTSIKGIQEAIDELLKVKGRIFSYKSVTNKQLHDAFECDKGFYFFEIYSKDFSKKKGEKSNNSNENLHTKYFKSLLSEGQTVFDLGNGEIFLRSESLKPEIDIRGKGEKKREVIKYKRYTSNKILFYLSVIFNCSKIKVPEKKGAKKAFINNFNFELNKDILINNSDINIIGIDRGEKHLAYYSVVNKKGEILDIGSFNKIKERDDKEPTNYQQKLDKIEKDRDWQRKSWQEISNIKEMKKGYISQVVHQICKLIKEHNAIVVFEDLNIGFKRGRFAIEKQIYQNLELALAKKLNYLVFKDAREEEKGHHLQAYQLTPPVDNFQDIGKQCGIMFYIPASYTSAVCPVCGFRKNISTPVEKREKNKELLSKFTISYEADKDRFCFLYKRSDFYKPEKENKNKGESGIKLFEEIKLQDKIVFYSNVERLKYKRNYDNRGGQVEFRDPNEELKNLFEKNGINFVDNSDISKQIKNKEFENENFYKPLINKIALIIQLRNNKTEKNEDGTTNEKDSRDFISCPHCYFHSEKNLLRLSEKYKGEGEFEFNGDANGAYNIARKGSLILRKINKAQDLEKVDFNDLTVSQEEWDKYVSQASSN